VLGWFFEISLNDEVDKDVRTLGFDDSGQKFVEPRIEKRRRPKIETSFEMAGEKPTDGDAKGIRTE